jgi:hypothetical protein
MISAQSAFERLDSTIRAIDGMVERINRFKVEPRFSAEMKERELKRPDFNLKDEYLLSRLVALIAYSQQAPSDRVTRLLQTPIFSEIFHDYSVEESAGLSPDKIINAHWPQITAIRFKSKIDAMVDCAKCLLLIQKQYGSFMKYLEKSGLPSTISSDAEFVSFWEGFNRVQAEFLHYKVPYFCNLTSLCHLLLDFGFDCAKPDSAVMKAAVDLGIVPLPPMGRNSEKRRNHPEENLRTAVQTIQAYAVRRRTRVPVIDQYFLIHGGQRDSVQFVRPDYFARSA